MRRPHEIPLHIVGPVLAAMAVVGLARAQPADVPLPVDAAGQDEEYVIRPGAEPLFADMLGSGQTLSGGCKLTDGQIQHTSVVATYDCSGQQVVLQLLHPEIAPRGGVRTQRFVIAVKSGAPPAGFVETVADRIRAREAAFEWMDIGGHRARPRRWAVPVAVGAVVAIFVAWSVRRRRRA